MDIGENAVEPSRSREGDPAPGRADGGRELRAHWGAIAGADFFTAEVWTWRGLVTSVFVIDLASHRVHILGSTPFPNDQFMRQVTRTLTAADHAWESVIAY